MIAPPYDRGYCSRIGRFELADRGTRFSDEVSEIPLDLGCGPPPPALQSNRSSKAPLAPPLVRVRRDGE